MSQVETRHTRQLLAPHFCDTFCVLPASSFTSFYILLSLLHPPLLPPPSPTQEATDPVSESRISDALIRFGAPSPPSPPAVSSSVNLHARLLLLLCAVQSPWLGCLIPNIPPGGAADVYLFHLSVCRPRLKKILYSLRETLSAAPLSFSSAPENESD